MMENKQTIIARIEAILMPRKPLVKICLIQDEQDPEQFWHQGKKYSIDEAKKLPANIRKFIIKACHSRAMPAIMPKLERTRFKSR